MDSTFAGSQNVFHLVWRSANSPKILIEAFVSFLFHHVLNVLFKSHKLKIFSDFVCVNRLIELAISHPVASKTVYRMRDKTEKLLVLTINSTFLFVSFY